MKVLMTYWSFLPARGGVEYHMHDIAQGLIGKGHSVDVLVFDRRKPKISSSTELQVMAFPVPSFLKRIRYFLFIFALIGLFRAIRKVKPDIIHAHDYLYGMAAAVISKITKIPVVLTMHLPLKETSGRPWLGLGWLERLARGPLLKQITQIICVSYFTLRSCIVEGFPSELLKVIYNWPRSLTSSEYRSRGPDTSSERLNILSVGALIYRKNPHSIIKAAARLRKRGVSIHLNLVGKGPMENVLRHIASKTGFSTIRIGPASDSQLAKYYSQCEIFVLASYSEGLPLVLTEAMCKGIPVVATAVGGVPEIVVDGHNGLLVSPDVDSLYKALLFLAENPNERKRMGENAITTISERFSHSNLSETINALEKAVNTHRF
jgi:1,4-alpha-glucan branching enzyme